jgi:hypothetical protein
VERDTPRMPILGGGERDAQCTSKVHDPDTGMPEKYSPAPAFRHQGQSGTGGHARVRHCSAVLVSHCTQPLKLTTNFGFYELFIQDFHLSHLQPPSPLSSSVS